MGTVSDVQQGRLHGDITVLGIATTSYEHTRRKANTLILPILEWLFLAPVLKSLYIP
jgi:hypothetical protein